MSGSNLPFLADRIFNVPLAIAPGKAEAILGALQARLGIAEVLPSRPEQSAFLGQRRRLAGGTSLGRFVGQTALITINGSLVNRGAWIDAQSGVVSYDGIAAQLAEAADDPEIKAIVIDMNSYGGEATGMTTLAAKVRAVRKSKRVVAIVNDVAASAGYGIVSQADEVVISPTSMVGSIGVVLLHLDRSGELAAKGVRPTLIHAGARKVDGNPFGPLPENVRADMERDVMRFYGLFVEAVEHGRGRRLSAAKARATEAAVFIGEDAIKAGLADRIGTIEEVLAELNRPSARSAGATKKAAKGNLMLENDEAEIRASERKRIRAITTLPEAAGREAQAMSLALDTDMAPSAAATLLVTLPKAAPTKVNTPTIEERAAESEEIGAGTLENGLRANAAKAGWDKVIARHNKPFSTDEKR